MRKCLLFLALLGCGDNTPSSDATLAITDDDGTATSALTIESTLVGQSASIAVHVKNAGTGATGPLAISFQGAAVGDYALDDQLTTCTGRALGPQEACDVAIVFRPTAGGDRHAMLVINSNPGGTATVDLNGTGTMADLHWTPTAGLDFGQMEVGSGISTTVWLFNDGAVAAPIDSITTTTPGYGLGGNTCGTVLPAGASCVVFLLVSPATVGANNGMLNVVSSGQTYSTPLLVHGARRITLVTTNTGMIATGTASSSPAGLACAPNSTCTGLFETDVLLTAVPGPNSAVGSWSVAGCGTATTCNVVVAPTPITVTVNFVISNAGLLNITFAGTSVGLVRVVDGSITHDCTSDCTLPITPGNTIKVRPSTPSKFGGMTGVCPVMPDSDLVSCSFTAPMGTSNLGVTFDKYPNELWTRVLGESGDDALHVEYDGSGNVIVAYKNGLTKLSPTGATLWTISTLVTSLAVGPGDSDFIYVGTGGGVMKVDPNGVVLWSSATNTFGTDLLDHIAVAPDGAVALRSGTLNGTAIVRRWNNGGALTWTKTFTVPNQDTTVGSIIFDRFETLYVVFNTGARRFAPDGTELAPLAQVVPDVASRLQITSTTLRSMFVGGVAPNFVRFEGSLDLATGTYTQTSNLGGAEPIEPGFVLPNFGFAISNNGHSGDADFYQLDNGTSDTFPMAFRINGAFDRKVYYHEDGMGPIGPFGGAVPRNIAYHRTSTASAQFVLSGNWDGLAWVQAFSD